MRKVHQNVIAAIRNQKRMRQGNYEVKIGHDNRFVNAVADVYLFGNHVARWHYRAGHNEYAKLTICPVVCSNTTKGILHELLVELAHTQHGFLRLYQRNYQWWLETTNGFEGQDQLAIDSRSVVQVRWFATAGCWILDIKGCELSVAA